MSDIGNREQVERCVTGCVIWEPERALSRISDEVPLEAFADSQCRAIVKTALAMWREGQAIDIMTLAERLGGDWARVVSDLNVIQDLVPSPANLPSYLEILKEQFQTRQIREMAEMVLLGIQEGRDNVEVITGIESALSRISDGAVKGRDLPSMKELCSKLLERTQAEAEGRVSFLPTGFFFLDRMMKVRGGELIIIAARPAVGKTAFALNIGERMAKAGYPVGVFSLEMADIEMAGRLVQSMGQVSLERFANQVHSEDDHRGLSMGVSMASQLPIHIDDTPNLNVAQIRSRAKAMHRRHGIKALFVDYLQLTDSMNSRANKTDQIGEISRGLKLIAKELGIPVFALSQLSRDCEKEKREPRLSDLRSSGDIEADADKVLLLHRMEDAVKVIIAKQRGGQTGVVMLKWLPEYTRFENLSPIDEG